MVVSYRLISHFQPIVYAKNTAHIFGYEALVRGLNEQGELISPDRIFATAQTTHSLSAIDLAARHQAIREANLHQIQKRIFINFILTEIQNPELCLYETLQTIQTTGISQKNVIFEIVETIHPQALRCLHPILEKYREAGFQFALDDFGFEYSSFNLLYQLRPDYMKLDMELIRNVHQDAYKALITEKLLEIAQELKIQTIAEGIEQREELAWLQERGADFVQGFLIAKPDAFPAQSIPQLV